MADEDFFEEQDPASKIKTDIVCDYFEAWSKVITSVQDRSSRWPNEISYIDLYAGRGRYEDGTPSTALRIVQSAIEHDELHDRFYAYLNDENEEFADELRQNVEELDGVEKLKHTPTIDNVPVDDSTARSVRAIDLPPSLVFLDPWGYAGLSVELFRAYLSNWGTDIIFFFNYNRINPGLSNEAVADHMNRLFGGSDKTEAIREQLDNASSPSARQDIIVDGMREALEQAGGKWMLKFEFRAPHADRPSHYLFFASAHYRGFEVMKSILSKVSSRGASEAPLFDQTREIQTNLAFEELPIEELKAMLLNRFEGQRLIRDKLVKIHQGETGFEHAYKKKHYNQALRELEDEERIAIHSSEEGRRKGTFPDYVDIQFPDNEEQADE